MSGKKGSKMDEKKYLVWHEDRNLAKTIYANSVEEASEKWAETTKSTIILSSICNQDENNSMLVNVLEVPTQLASILDTSTPAIKPKKVRVYGYYTAVYYGYEENINE